MQRLAERTFSAEDQARFAALSGDFNPMHMDAVAARRTAAGAPVAHGIHSLLWLLDTLAGRLPDLPAVAAFKARFSRMVYVGEAAEACLVQRTDAQLRADVRVDAATAVQLTLTFGAPAEAEHDDLADAPVMRPPATPLDRVPEEMAKLSGRLAFHTPAAELARAFPHAARLLGAQRVAALAATTCLVGMVVPGLHSIYGGLSVTLRREVPDDATIGYRVTAYDERMRLLRQEVMGAGIHATLETFARQPPTAQADMAEAARHVRPDEFAGVSALVIGGSRGLGELTAKLIAAGGGRVCITYAHGRADAERVAAEIGAAGGRCTVLPYDIHAAATPQLAGLNEVPNQLYYFATPGIFRPRSGLFSSARFAEFSRFYASAFGELVEAAARQWPDGLRVFYPSSVAVAERPPGMTEYAMAKAAGEVLCADLDAQSKTLRVMCPRLPRLPTDQTATLMPVRAADPLQTLLPLLREMAA